MRKKTGKYFEIPEKAEDIRGIRISIASPEWILNSSYGECSSTGTVHYGTLQTERKGILSSEIFGPMVDYECSCGRLGFKHRGQVCEKCGVEVISSSSRRVRCAHITPDFPLVNPLYYRTIAVLLDIDYKLLLDITYLVIYIVIRAGLTHLKEGDLLTLEMLKKNQHEYGESAFSVETGGAAVKFMLKKLNLQALKVSLKEDLDKTTSDVKRNRIIKRNNVVNSFIRSGNHPDWMVLDYIPVKPAGLRPLVQLDNGRWVVAGENNTLRFLAASINRSRNMADTNAPDILRRSERRLAQARLSILYGVGGGADVKNKAYMPSNAQVVKGLADQISGKEGKFRGDCLGKRMDYSARGHISPGTRLNFDQCGLPKRWALEMWRPQLYNLLMRGGHATTTKAAKKIVDRRDPICWDLLEVIAEYAWVMLNRQPSLHKGSMQAFRPLLHDGNAIQLYPLTCTQFNADFDGDTMTVYAVLTYMARLEAALIMSSSKHILNPSNGKPMVVPQQDIAAGLYYLTMDSKGVKRFSEPEKDVLSKFMKKGPKLIADVSKKDFDKLERAVKNNVYIAFSEEQKEVIRDVIPDAYQGENWDLVPEYATDLTESDVLALKEALKTASTDEEKRVLHEILDFYNNTVVDLNSAEEHVLMQCIGKIRACLFPAKIYKGVSEVENALVCNRVLLHSPIVYIHVYTNEDGDRVEKRYKTTPGRVIFFDILPRSIHLPFDLVNKACTKKVVSDLIQLIYTYCSLKQVVDFCDDFKDIGFKMSCLSGLSVGLEDLLVLDTKDDIVKKYQSLVDKCEEQWSLGLLTRDEKRNKVINLWNECTNEVDKQLDIVYKSDPANPVSVALDSGARGNRTQMVQLVGVKGLTHSGGEIVDTPILSNYREGLSVQDYITATSGTRKGLEDTACKTGVSGYMMRRTMDALIDIVVKMRDCGTTTGWRVSSVIENGTELHSLYERILGRYLAKPVCDKKGKVVVPAGTFLNEELASLVVKTGVSSVDIRSPLCCECPHLNGVCAKCVGRDLSTGAPIELGSAIGINSGHSLTKGVTQATLSNFHRGGAVSLSDKFQIVAFVDGKIEFFDLRYVYSEELKIHVVTSSNAKVKFYKKDNSEVGVDYVPYGARLYITENSKVVDGDEVANWDSFTTPVITEVEGYAQYVDIIDGHTVIEQVDEITGLSNRVIISSVHSQQQGLSPLIAIVDDKGDPVLLSTGVSAKYHLFLGAVLSVNNGDKVPVGTILARIPCGARKTEDIIGGMSLLDSFLECRVPANSAVVAESDGVVSFGKLYKGKYKIMVTGYDGKEYSYAVSMNRNIIVHSGDPVIKGHILVEGIPNPHDILRVHGVQKMQEYLITQIRNIYDQQGIEVSEVHIEVLVARLLSHVEVVCIGDSESVFLGEYYPRCEIQRLNSELAQSGKNPIKYIDALLGVTKIGCTQKSWLARGTCRDTIRAFTSASVKGECDELLGIKEACIIGKLLPCGTGFWANLYKKNNKAEILNKT